MVNKYSQKNLEDIRDLLLDGKTNSQVAEIMTRSGLRMSANSVSSLWNGGRVKSVCSDEDYHTIQKLRADNTNNSHKKSKKRVNPQKATKVVLADKRLPPLQSPFKGDNTGRKEPRPLVFTAPPDTSASSAEHREGACRFMFEDPNNTRRDLYCNAYSITEMVGGKYSIPESLKKGAGKNILPLCPYHAFLSLYSDKRKNDLREILTKLSESGEFGVEHAVLLRLRAAG